ncbi:MAG: hypothetical protein ACRD29_06340 [Acidimicrobiales bacterium]
MSVPALASSLFPTNGALPPDGLIGRHEEVAALVEALTEGEHQILTGPGKIGKTSVAGAAIASLPMDWFRVSVDLFRMTDIATLVARLMDYARAGNGDPRSKSKATFHDALMLIEDVTASDNLRIVLTIDGFEEIVTTQLFGKADELTQEMRSAIDKTSRITCLFVGNAPCVMRDLFTAKDQPFARFGTVGTLGPIPAPIWRDGLRARFVEGGCEIGDAPLDRLLKLSRGHPRSTMLIAQWSFTLARAAGRRTIDDPVAIDEGFRGALTGEVAVAESELTRVRTLGKHALGTALRVAKDESPYKNLPPAIARQTLRSLETAGVVEHPRSGAWQIVDPLFQEHLLRVTNDVRPPVVLAPPMAPAQPAERVEPAEPVERVEPWPLGEPVERAEPPIPAEPVELVEPVRAAKPVDLPPAAEEPIEVPPVPEERVQPHPTTEPLDDDASPDLEEQEPPASTEHLPSDVDGEITLDPNRLSLRHPQPDEGQRVGRLVAHVVSSRRRQGHPGGTDRVDEPAAEPKSEAVSGRRFGRFIERVVARRPGWYWQLEADRRPVGGVVLYRPRAIIGSGTTTGIDPLLQFVLLAVATTLSIGGLVLLLVKRSWEWGGLAGLLFAAFIACGIQAVLLGREVLGRAQASWIARRYGGTVVEGLWSEPDEALPAVFQALATELPGTLVTAYADTPDRMAAYRNLGFSTGRGRVVAGVLSPKNGKPVRSIAAAPSAPRPRPKNGRRTPESRPAATAVAPRASTPVKTTHGRSRPVGRTKGSKPHRGRPRGHR